MTNYQTIEISKEELIYQNKYNEYLVTPYDRGIVVNFTSEISLNCIDKVGLIIKFENYVIECTSNSWIIGEK